MNRWGRMIIDNIFMVLIVIGSCCGILSFFINWETVIEATTTGLDFAFGTPHEFWYKIVGNQSYIPLIIFLCSVISGVMLVYNTYHKEEKRRIMIIALLIGIVMLFLMTYWSSVSFIFNGEHCHFADYIGVGTHLAWTAANFITIGAGMYVASEVIGGKDGQ